MQEWIIFIQNSIHTIRCSLRARCNNGDEYRDICINAVNQECWHSVKLRTSVPSHLPPRKLLPSSFALRENGRSSIDDSLASGGSLGTQPALRIWRVRSLTRRAREHRASLNMPARARRPSTPSVFEFWPSTLFELAEGEVDVGKGPNDLTKRRTSSTTSSSQRLSLIPSEARTRMSSA